MNQITAFKIIFPDVEVVRLNIRYYFGIQGLCSRIWDKLIVLNSCCRACKLLTERWWVCFCG